MFKEIIEYSSELLYKGTDIFVYSSLLIGGTYLLGEKIINKFDPIEFLIGEMTEPTQSKDISNLLE